jgi:hypothetical protein
MEQQSLSTLPFVKLKIGTEDHGHKTVLALWDSGCSNTICSLACFESLKDLPLIPYRPLAKPRRIKLAGTGEHYTAVVGTATLHLKFETTDDQFFILKHTVHIVTNLAYDFFIGSDILNSDAVKFQTGNTVVMGSPLDKRPGAADFLLNRNVTHRQNDWKFVTIRYRNVMTTTSLVAIEKVTLAPHESSIVYAAVETPLVSREELGIFLVQGGATKKRHKERLLIHESRGAITNPSKIPMLILNKSDEYTTLHKGVKLGKIQLDIAEQEEYTRPSPNCIAQSTGQAPTAKNNHAQCDAIAEQHPHIMQAVIAANSIGRRSQDLPDRSAIHRTINEDKTLTKAEKESQLRSFRENGYYTKSATFLMEEKGGIQTLEALTPNETHILTDAEIISAIDLRHLSSKNRQLTREMLRNNLDVFSRNYRDFGTVENFEAHVDLKPHEKTLQQRYVPLPLSARKEVTAILDQFLELGLIEYSQELDPYISNLLITKKKDGALRILMEGPMSGAITSVSNS